MFNQLNFSRMKRTLLLAGTALLALVACNKSRTVVKEAPGEITFKAVNASQTKGAELDGTTFPTSGYLLYAAATSTQNNSYFTDQQFAYDSENGNKWRGYDGSAFSKIYWPMGGAKVDFLAFAMPTGKYGTSSGQIKPAFASPKVANGFSLSDWNVYENEFELMYAANNGLSSTASPVALQFQHALSVVIFNVKMDPAVDATVKINSITFDELVKEGNFEVDNSKNDLVATWTLDSAVDNVPFVIDATAAEKSTLNSTAEAANFVNNNTDIKAQTTFAQIGESKLMIPQPARNFTVNYSIGANTLDYHLNVPRQPWEAGKVYLYNLTISLNEITLNPTVVDWDDPTLIPVGLN